MSKVQVTSEFPSDSDLMEGTCFLLSLERLEEGLRTCCLRKVVWSTREEPYRIRFTLYGSTLESREASFKALQDHFSMRVIQRGVVDPVIQLLDALKQKNFMLSGAESCTGGLISRLLTDVPGSSQVFWGGFITYANEAKEELGVDTGILAKYGAVSRETVHSMVQAVAGRSGTECAFAVSGIAGPEGGSEEKPVGTVWTACFVQDRDIYSRRFLFPGSREDVRKRAAVATLLLLLGMVKGDERLDTASSREYI